jgi:hypothetical protein
MLCLASGRAIGLSIDRAKYHALHHRGPAPDAEHRALYKLVDVIYRKRDKDGTPRRGWTEHDYEFSGYTLADIYQAKDWSDADKAALFRWAAERTQKQLIESCRRRLVEFQTQLSTKYYRAPQSLYSHLQQSLQALPLQAATAQQWQGTIRNMPGIRQEELEWSGLQTTLSNISAETVLSKQQILDAIDFRNIRLALSAEKIWGIDGGLSFREVAQRMPHQAVYLAALKLDTRCQCVLRYVDDSHNYRVGVVKTLEPDHHMALNRYWFALDPYGRAIRNSSNDSLFFPNSEVAKARADQHARDELNIKGGACFHTRFDHLTLYGGTNYREWLVTLPDYQRIFFGAHHFDHNVLAHLRTTTRLDTQGRKLLFIEEVQSDWHQNGQQNGYDSSPWGKVANAPFKKEWPVLAVKLMLIHASQNGFDGIAWADGSIQETRYTRALQTIKRRYDLQIPQALRQLGKPFHARVERTTITIHDPWLNVVKQNNKWRVSDGTGKFETRDKYQSLEEAMQLIHRHCKTIELPVSMFIINDDLRWEIAERGLPLFGEVLSLSRGAKG